jgi:hypothetical protein
MDKPGTAARWFHAWRSEPVPQPDFADLGTAFGLDMSLMDALPAELAPETQQRRCDEGLEGADDPRRAWAPLPPG